MTIAQEENWSQNLGSDHIGRVQDYLIQEFGRDLSFCDDYLAQAAYS